MLKKIYITDMYYKGQTWAPANEMSKNIYVFKIETNSN